MTNQSIPLSSPPFLASSDSWSRRQEAKINKWKEPFTIKDKVKRKIEWPKHPWYDFGLKTRSYYNFIILEYIGLLVDEFIWL